MKIIQLALTIALSGVLILSSSAQQPGTTVSPAVTPLPTAAPSPSGHPEHRGHHRAHNYERRNERRAERRQQRNNRAAREGRSQDGTRTDHVAPLPSATPQPAPQ